MTGALAPGQIARRDGALIDYLDPLLRKRGSTLDHAQAAALDRLQQLSDELKAFRAAHTFEPGTNVRAWLFTILHNTAKNRTRDLARAATSVDTEAVERVLDSPDGPGPVMGEELLPGEQ